MNDVTRYGVKLFEGDSGILISEKLATSPMHAVIEAIRFRARIEGVGEYYLFDDFTSNIVVHQYCDKDVTMINMARSDVRIAMLDSLKMVTGPGDSSDGQNPFLDPKSGVQNAISEKCDQVKDLLLRKNADYGNSALDPVRIFSKADAEEQIRVRIDDKLSRLAGAGEKNFTEDTVMDLVGYLILLMVKMEEG